MASPSWENKPTLGNNGQVPSLWLLCGYLVLFITGLGCKVRPVQKEINLYVFVSTEAQCPRPALGDL